MSVDLDKLYKCKIETIIKYYTRFSCDIFIKLSDDKIVKLIHKDEDFVESLIKYQSKGLKYVHIDKEAYDQFVVYYKDAVEKINVDDSPIEKSVADMDMGYDLVKESAIKIGISEIHLEIAEVINKKAMKAIKKEKKLLDLLIKLKEHSAEEFAKNMLISYVATGILSLFPWHNDDILEKASRAIMLRDVNLEACDVKLLHLPLDDLDHKTQRKIKNHPHEISRMLEKYPDLVSKDLLTMIEQHHELPDGSGYPRGLKYDTISTISAVIIVACRFIDLVYKKHLEAATIKHDIKHQFTKEYDQGNFKGIIERLIRILS